MPEVVRDRWSWQPVADGPVLELNLIEILERYEESRRFFEPSCFSCAPRWSADALLPTSSTANRPRMTTATLAGPRTVRAPRGTELSCRGWQQEAALRMLMNNLDPDVAERPEDLVVYGGTGRAARSWEAFDAIVRDAALAGRRRDPARAIRQAGRRVPHARRRAARADRQLQPGAALGRLGDFRELERHGLTMYGQMTAGSWIYIGTQGILQGTYETFGAVARQHFGGSLRGRWTLTGGMGGMGGAQPLAVTMNEGAVLVRRGGPCAHRAPHRRRATAIA